MNEHTTTIEQNGSRFSVQKSLNRVFSNSAVISGLRFGLGRAQRTPRINVNVSETDDEVLVSADIPGMSAEDISIEIKGNGLTISGDAKEEVEEVSSQRKFLRYERTAGSFSRHLVLPAQVDESTIDGYCRNGVLLIRLKKRMAAESHRGFTIANTAI